MMDDRFKKLENQLLAMTNLLQQKKQVKHKGRGKKSTKQPSIVPKSSISSHSDPIQSTSRGIRASSRGSIGRNQHLSQEAISRLNNFIESETPTGQLAAAIDEDLFTEDLDDAPAKELKTVFIQKVDCQFNGNSIDSMEDKATVDQAMQQFWRMYYFNGQINSLFSNGLTYNDFLKGYFFCVYDLSTSNKAGSSYLVPAIRVGHLRMR
jgi:hypothetical protein